MVGVRGGGGGGADGGKQHLGGGLYDFDGIAEKVRACVRVKIECAACVDVARLDAVNVVPDFRSIDDDGSGREIFGRIASRAAAAAAGIGQIGAGGIFAECDLHVSAGEHQRVNVGRV